MEGVVIFTVSRRITITHPLRWRQTAESASVVTATRKWFRQIPTLNSQLMSINGLKRSLGPWVVRCSHAMIVCLVRGVLNPLIRIRDDSRMW